MTSTSSIKLLSCILVFLVFACKGEKEEYHNLIDKIEAKSVEYKRKSIQEQDLFDPNDLVQINENNIQFHIQNRKNKIQSFKCSECHTKPVAQLQTEGLGKKAHWDVTLKHADKNTMSCLSCHSDNDMNNLLSGTGKSIDLNYSYQLCNQCHNQQVKDWAGGAHGKNLSGWQGSRVSKLCTECHDPHDPSIKKRWPSRYNSVMVSERK